MPVIRKMFKGKPEMVGKVFHINGEWVFYHEDNTRYGTQRHIKLDSPGGVDISTLEWLEENQVFTVQHYTAYTKTLLITSTGDIRRFGEVVMQGGRGSRYFLPFKHWREGMPYKTPWVEGEVNLE